MDLDPYQVEGAAFLLNAPGKGALLADEPGLGKTRQAIRAALDHCVRSVLGHPWGHIAVVCPASALGVWRREIKAFGARANWQIRSFEKASELVDVFDVLIIDEAHKIKTRDSKRTQLLLGEKCDGVNGLVSIARKVILLTGTPTPNNPSEIWPIARACFPDAISFITQDGTKLPMSYWQFVKKYCVTEQNWLGHLQIKGGKNLDELRKRLAPHVLRRRKADVLKDLAPARHSILPVEGRIAHSELLDLDIKLAADALQRLGVDGLRQAAPHVATLRRITGMAKVEGVADWVRDWFDGGGGKLVVFAYHKEVIRALHARFERDEINHVVGGAPGRTVSVALFQEDPRCRLFLGQLEADGTAITLTATSTLVFAEYSWVPSDNDQAWQRIHRRGQQNACDIRYATLAGSIDEDIAEALIPKKETIDKLWNSFESSVETLEG